jgi:hypothetical protein
MAERFALAAGSPVTLERYMALGGHDFEVGTANGLTYLVLAGIEGTEAALAVEAIIPLSSVRGSCRFRAKSPLRREPKQIRPTLPGGSPASSRPSTTASFRSHMSNMERHPVLHRVQDTGSRIAEPGRRPGFRSGRASASRWRARHRCSERP